MTDEEGAALRVGVAIPAAIAIAAFVGTASLWVSGQIEGDLTSRSRAALDAAGIRAAVRYDGLDAILTGVVTDSREAADAIRIVRGVRGTQGVASQLSLTVTGLGGTAAQPGTSATASGSGTQGTANGTPTQAPGASPTARPGTNPRTGLQLPTGSITFATNDAALSAQDQAYLDTVAGFLSQHREIRLTVRGHADDLGSAAVNWSLSRRRAEAVAGYLEAHGVAVTRLRVEAYGATQPLAPNDTPTGRATNRRVELALQEAR